MTEPANNPQSDFPPADPEANSQDLRRLINILFGGMLLISITLAAFLALEGKRAGERAKQAEVAVNQLAPAVQQEDANVSAAYTKLSEFARKHPDFQNQVLSKYKVTTAAPSK